VTALVIAHIPKVDEAVIGSGRFLLQCLNSYLMNSDGDHQIGIYQKTLKGRDESVESCGHGENLVPPPGQCPRRERTRVQAYSTWPSAHDLALQRASCPRDVNKTEPYGEHPPTAHFSLRSRAPKLSELDSPRQSSTYCRCVVADGRLSGLNQHPMKWKATGEKALLASRNHAPQPFIETSRSG